MSAPSPYAARPWEQHYDYWVRPHMTYPGRPLGDILSITAVQRPDKVATHLLTFLDLKRRSDALATSLAEMGIGKGDRVAIMLPNCPQYIIAAFGILRLGAVIVNVNPSYTEREFLVIAADSTPRVLITLDALAPMVQRVRTQTTLEQIIVTSLAEYSAAAAPPPRIDGTLPLADLVAVPGTSQAGAGHVPGTGALGADDLAVLQYTGGTTGTPKGAMLTHGNIFANVVQTIAWTNPMYLYGGEERYLVVIPYFHIYAFSVCMMMGLWIGALQVIHPKYEPDAVLASIKRFRPTYFPAVPTVFVSLLNHPKVLEHGLDQVRQFNSGGAPCPVDVLEQWERTIGRPLYEGYGLSETSPVTHTTPQLARRRMGSIGLPVPDTDMKIVDVEHGTREIPPGEAGEICISGPQVMKGYWNKPEESASVLRADATGRIWFHTGDIGTMDADGFAHIVQRKKDMIIVDGFNVYPSEVESILYSHPAVRLAAVIGVPDTYHGETVKACIAFKPGTTATADEIIAFCRTSLTDYKVPRAIEVRETLPMSAVGKILYRVLRDEHASAGAAQS
ncbi:MAG: long-chain fatty acid--CoA ligase [Acidobacteria bacterium]|nr:long-chain fatty acid--CoA ligase [Acidobacteriota bacterium]